MFGCVPSTWSVTGSQAWIAELHVKCSTIKSFCSGQTRSSRDVTPIRPSAGPPISPTTVGAAGDVASTTRIPGCGCPFDESVRLPT